LKPTGGEKKKPGARTPENAGGSYDPPLLKNRKDKHLATVKKEEDWV